MSLADMTPEEVARVAKRYAAEQRARFIAARLATYRVAALPIAMTTLTTEEVSTTYRTPVEVCRVITERTELLAKAMLTAETGSWEEFAPPTPEELARAEEHAGPKATCPLCGRTT